VRDRDEAGDPDRVEAHRDRRVDPEAPHALSMGARAATKKIRRSAGSPSGPNARGA
jgi:hypothetical protein